jgi:hypothetical protein
VVFEDDFEDEVEDDFDDEDDFEDGDDEDDEDFEAEDEFEGEEDDGLIVPAAALPSKEKWAALVEVRADEIAAIEGSIRTEADELDAAVADTRDRILGDPRVGSREKHAAQIGLALLPLAFGDTFYQARERVAGRPELQVAWRALVLAVGERPPIDVSTPLYLWTWLLLSGPESLPDPSVLDGPWTSDIEMARETAKSFPWEADDAVAPTLADYIGEHRTAYEWIADRILSLLQHSDILLEEEPAELLSLEEDVNTYIRLHLPAFFLIFYSICCDIDWHADASIRTSVTCAWALETLSSFPIVPWSEPDEIDS